eukprot:m.227851 g.227851  ORF g.227851 m.227851 type:complete len:608 (-) comp22378_c0_seq2:44-1867(-)
MERWVELLRGYEGCALSSEDYLAQHGASDEEEDVFEGCQRHRAVLKSTVKSFFVLDGALMLPSDRHFFEVVTFVCIFLVPQKGLEECCKWLKTGNPKKTAVFLQFLYSDNAYNGALAREWKSIYDGKFVVDRLVQPLQENAAEMTAFAVRLLASVEQTHRTQSAGPRTTIPKPFKLTETKPKTPAVMAEEPRRPATVAPRAVPDSTYRTPLENQARERRERQKQERALQLLHKAQQDQFSIAAAQPKSQRTQQRMDQYKQSKEHAATYRPPKQKPISAAVFKPVEVKLNAAAVLREERFHRKQIEEEAKRLAALEAGEFDSEAFMRFEEEQRALRQQQEMDEIEKKVLMGQLSREDAIIARHEAVKRRQQAAQDVKAETSLLMQKFMQIKAEQEAANRKLVEETAAQLEAAREAKEKVAEVNAQKKLDVQGESRHLLQQAKEQELLEIEKRDELIRQIRALESAPVSRVKVVDHTETSNMGLMSEMSLAELRERLNLLKTTRAEEEEARRQDILMSKAEREAVLKEKMDTIVQGRLDLERKSRQATARVLKPSLGQSKDAKVLELRERLQAKRADRERLNQASALGSRSSSAGVLASRSTSKPKAVS